MPPAEKHILEIDSAELAFGGRSILSGVYLLAETGCVTAVLGRNGCGKSCLMKILSGALKAGFCSMRIDGKWHGRFTEKEVRYLPQHAFIPGWLRLERVLRDFGLSREELERWFPLFVPLRGSRIGELSGGEQRILECFVILRSRTQFVLLDEPFAGIDPLAVGDIQGLVRALRDRGIGVLISDHNVRETLTICDRAYLMVQGQVVLSGTPETIVNNEQARSVYLGEGFSL